MKILNKYKNRFNAKVTKFGLVVEPSAAESFYYVTGTFMAQYLYHKNYYCNGFQFIDIILIFLGANYPKREESNCKNDIQYGVLVDLTRVRDLYSPLPQPFHDCTIICAGRQASQYILRYILLRFEVKGIKKSP